MHGGIHPDFSVLWSVVTSEAATRDQFGREKMQRFFILFFFARLVTLTWAEPDSDDLDEWDDFLRPTPDQNPLLGAPALDNSLGPLPSFVDLNLHLKYDLSLLAQFGGSKEEAEGYLERVVQLARLFLLHPKLVVKIHIKVIIIFIPLSFTY